MTSPSGKTRGEPNDSFTQAMFAVFDDNSVARLQGTIDRVSDLDVFAIGALNAGDRVVIETTANGGPLDPSIALFDDLGRVVGDNDDREEGGNPLDARLDMVIRHGGVPYYLVIGHSAFASTTGRTGSYTATVAVETGGAVPPPTPQRVLIDFDGGTTDAVTLPVNMVEPFDAGSIDARYAGQTEGLKAFIMARIRGNFADFAVEVTSSDEPLPQRPYTTLLMGGFNPQAFGISESVDHYNFDACDDGIVFTESFDPAFFSVPPTVAQLGRAIGNVTSHELGHLLGLNHVTDPTAIMDGASPADTFILDQRFKEAPLSRDILRIGTQDDPLLLSEIVGLRPE